MTDGAILQSELLQATEYWWHLARQHWYQPLRHSNCPSVQFDLRGRCAGQLRLRRTLPGLKPELIRYNLVLAANNETDFIEQTVPHEVAHAVAVILHGRAGTGHGAGWREVMHFFGKPLTRCHDYDVSAVAARRTRKFPYRCHCAVEHHLGSIRHRRMQTGERIYQCRKCKAILSLAL
ncbi:MAG: SprT-like domain-containing protein [Gammaproteobacteria bacterium]